LSASDSFHSKHERTWEEEQGLSLVTDVNMKSTSGPVNVEKILKKFKTHRCAMDFDNAFCKAIFTKNV
jgi:hypothetical protein